MMLVYFEVFEMSDLLFKSVCCSYHYLHYVFLLVDMYEELSDCERTRYCYIVSLV